MVVPRRFSLICSYLALLLLLPATICLAAPAPGDFDGDGKSDVSLGLVYRDDGSTAWLTRPSSGQAALFYTFDVAADAFVFGRYFAGDVRAYPGIVRVRDASLPLRWYIKNPQAQEVRLDYGRPGDFIPNQGDLDCDGVTDIIVVRSGTASYWPKFKLWYVALSSTGKVYETVFGMAGDWLAAADVNGDGCDEMIALRSGFRWFSKPLFGPDAVEVQWGLPGDLPLLPQDLNGDGAADYVIARPGKTVQTAYVRYSDSSWTSLDLGSTGTLPMLGRFENGVDFAFWDRAKSTLAFRAQDGSFNEVPFGIPTNVLIRPDGTVLQPNEDGRLKEESQSGAVVPAGNCSRPKFPDGAGGFLWKPVKDGGSHTPGGPVILANNSITDIKIYAGDGQMINDVPLRYRNGSSGNRSYWDPTKTAAQFKPYAPLTIRVWYPSGKCEDRAVGDPTKRYD